MSKADAPDPTMIDVLDGIEEMERRESLFFGHRVEVTFSNETVEQSLLDGARAAGYEVIQIDMDKRTALFQPTDPQLE